MSVKRALSSREDEEGATHAERTLLSRHRSGDRQAFPELMGLYRAQVYTYLVRCSVPEGTRDDLFQEIFLTIHRKARSYNPAYPLGSWIFTIVANKVRDYFRAQKVQRVFSEDSTAEASSPEATPQELSTARVTAGWLEEAMTRLPPVQRELLMLCSMKGLSQREAARALKISIGAVKTHIFRARVFLARALAARNSRLKREVSK